MSPHPTRQCTQGREYLGLKSQPTETPAANEVSLSSKIRVEFTNRQAARQKDGRTKGYSIRSATRIDPDRTV